MNADKLIFRTLLFALIVIIAGCSSDKPAKDNTAEPLLTQREADSVQIQGNLNEILERWRYGDKSVLYEQEFPYYKFEFSYDDFLSMEHVKKMNTDSAYAFDVEALKFFDRDSVSVGVKVTFKGPTGHLSYDYDSYKMYNSDGRWVRPSFSAPQYQKEFEEARRVADSAAAADEDLEDY